MLTLVNVPATEKFTILRTQLLNFHRWAAYCQSSNLLQKVASIFGFNRTSINKAFYHWNLCRDALVLQNYHYFLPLSLKWKFDMQEWERQPTSVHFAGKFTCKTKTSSVCSGLSDEAKLTTRSVTVTIIFFPQKRLQNPVLLPCSSFVRFWPI